MKKLILVLLLAVVTSGSAWAQKGMMGIGIGLTAHYALIDNGGFGVGGNIKYQYNISDYIRVEPSLSYIGNASRKDRGFFDITALVNFHGFFASPRNVRPYFFAGFGYMQYKYHNTVDKQIVGGAEHFNGMGVDGGMGVDLRISHDFSLQIEAGIMKGFKDEACLALFWQGGVCYNF